MDKLGNKENKMITIIGSGFIGISLAKGLRLAKRDSEIIMIDKVAGEKDGFKISNDKKSALQKSNIVILAVQKEDVFSVCSEIVPLLNKKDYIVVSVVAGLNLSQLQSYFQKEISVSRVMPNIGMSVGYGLTAVCSNNKTTENSIVELFSSVGKTIVLSEDKFDAFTVLSGSGVAFVMRFMRAMEQAGVEIGFHTNQSRKIVNQVIKGAQKLLSSKGTNPEDEIDKVTTPKGITITGLNEMEHFGLTSAVTNGIVKAFEKLR